MKLDTKWLLMVLRDTIAAAEKSEDGRDWFSLARSCGENVQGVVQLSDGGCWWTITVDGAAPHEEPLPWSQAVIVAHEVLGLDPPEAIPLPYDPPALLLPRTGGLIDVVPDDS